MKKHVFGRQFKRDVHERTALFKGLASELVMHERIVTTEQKAKAIRRTADKLVTKAKKTDVRHATSLLQPFLSSEAVKKMLSVIAPRFADRQGGYTRMVRLGRRFNDDAQQVRMEWVSLGDNILTAQSVKKATKSETETTQALPATIATTQKTATKKTKSPAKKAAPKKVTTKAKGEEK